ncbi:hypothetical protein [Luteolibacter soli]|uniref:DUF4349 domain-containing protein n=1 Tax=Luteolibacter soli TaxID=3135280 RepID=A0ABU9AS16_9BACT
MSLMIVVGFFIGWACGAFLCVKQPKRYLGVATIESPAHAGHAERLTPVRAKMVARDLDLENRWATTFEEAVAVIDQCSRLKSSADGVRIEVRYFDPRDAQRIAAQIASGLDVPARELEISSRNPEVKSFDFRSAAVLDDTRHLEWLLEEEARNALYPGCYELVKLAATGDPKATALVNSEDFSRRWKKFQELSLQIGYLNPPGEPFKAPNTNAKVAEILSAPVSPVIPLWTYGGGFSGAAAAGLLVLCLNRWKPAVLRPYPPKEPVPPEPPRPQERAIETDDPW